MSSIERNARVAGILYLAMSILAIASYFILSPMFVVPGDAQATARRITEGIALYRVHILISLVSSVLFLFVVMTLYQLFRDVDRAVALQMLVLVTVGVAVSLVVLGNHMLPLVLLSGADVLDPFTRPQLEALAYASHRWGTRVNSLLTGFWGAWLFPFGLLVIRSRYFPRILGVLLWVAGAGYVVSCVTRIVFPDQATMISRFLMPLYFGELPIIFWLAIRGARVSEARSPAAM
jgi:hypothetical protein